MDVHRKGILNILWFNVGAELVVDQLDHLIERVTLCGADVVDSLELVIGGEAVTLFGGTTTAKSNGNRIYATPPSGLVPNETPEIEGSDKSHSVRLAGRLRGRRPRTIRKYDTTEIASECEGGVECDQDV